MCKFIATCNETYFVPSRRFLIFLAAGKPFDDKHVWKVYDDDVARNNYHRNLALSPLYSHLSVLHKCFSRSSAIFCKHVYVFRSACTALFSERRVYVVTISDRSFHACCKVCYYKVQSQFVFIIDIFKFHNLFRIIKRSKLLHIFKIYFYRTYYVRNVIAGSAQFEHSCDVNISVLSTRRLNLRDKNNILEIIMRWK